MIKLLTATDVGSHGVNLTMRSWRQESASLSRCASSCCHMPTAIKGAFRDSETTFKSVGRCWMMLDDVFLCILPTSTDIYRPHRYKSLEWIECWRQEPSRTIFITCYYLLNPWTWAVSNLRQLLRDVKKKRCRKTSMKWNFAVACGYRLHWKNRFIPVRLAYFFFVHLQADLGFLFIAARTLECWPRKMMKNACLCQSSSPKLQISSSMTVETLGNTWKHVETCLTMLTSGFSVLNLQGVLWSRSKLHTDAEKEQNL